MELFAMSNQDGLKQAAINLDPIAALRAPVEVLLGVTASVKAALASLGHNTVFDLAASPLFSLAREISEAAAGKGSGAMARLSAVPGSVVGADSTATTPVQLAAADIASLRSLTATQVTQIKQQLQVETIGDLGRWPPFQSARNILEAAVGPFGDTPDDAAELVPRLGQFPTERRYYSTIVMDQVAANPSRDLVSAGPIDIAPTIDADFGFSVPAVGARLTFVQSWFAQGVTLGNLLHSVALAPGESTRIAMVDWSRQTRASGDESIAETEQLSNVTSHNRAVSEVQDAVAKEVQSGFSHIESTGTSDQGGVGIGLGIGPLTLGGSDSGSTTSTSADSFSSSSGQRTIAATMSQQVADATQQAASSVRNRRASIVKEVSEAEHESVSTRIIANYNHMHALTVQYYEVVELYRVVTGLNQVERCLFVPMKLIDFDDRVVRRYQGVLAAAALDRRALALLTTEFGVVRLSPALPVQPLVGTIRLPGGAMTLARTVATAVSVSSAVPAVAIASAAHPTQPNATTAPAPAPEATAPSVVSPPKSAFTWNADEVRRIGKIVTFPVVRPGVGDVFLPRDAAVQSVSFAGACAASIAAVGFKLTSGQPFTALQSNGFEWRTSTPVALHEIAEVVASTATGNAAAFDGEMTLGLVYFESWFPLTLPARVAAGVVTTLCKLSAQDAGPELLDHLRKNRLHYCQAIWRSLDASTIALLLSPYRFEAQPVANLVDPQPLMVAGNYLVLRMPGFIERAGLPVRDDTSAPGAAEEASRAAWRQWLATRGLTFGPEASSEQLVPVPTGGVFAEAVLGRSNCAELLDATRYWNWQDSPIPLQPPEIAAISLQSRAQPIDVQPGQLGQPVLNIVSPTSLPNPTGVGAVLSAIQNGNLFRDMSGLAATVGLAQATASDAASGATSAGQLAAANLAVAAQKQIEEDKIAAQLALAGMGAPGGTGPKNISEMGSVLNTAQKLDQRGAARPGTSQVGAGGAQGGGGGAGSAGGGIGAGVGVGAQTGGSLVSSGDAGTGSFTADALRRMIWGTLGGAAGDIVQSASAGSPAATQPLPLPVDEIFFYASVQKIGPLSTFSGEIDALQNGLWLSGTVDFRAISIRSAGGREPRSDAEIHSLVEFLQMLAQPARRFNFFSYDQSTSTNGVPNPDRIMMNASVQPGSISSTGTTMGGFDVSILDLPTVNGLAQLQGGLGTLPTLIRNIQQTNADVRKAVLTESGDGVRRELWLYTVRNSVPGTLAQGLAKLLDMNVFVFPKEIDFRPELQLTPLDELRGKIALGADATATTKDVHTLDGQALRFS
jgi:hypothetical protein